MMFEWPGAIMPVPDIQIITPKDYGAWDQYVLLHKQGGSYLTSAWKQSVEKAYGHKTFYLAAYVNRNITGLLPLVRIKPPMQKGTLVSLPYCDYGGIIANHHQDAEALLNQALSLASKMKVVLEIRNSSPCPIIEQNAVFKQVTDKCRMVMELPENSATLWSGFRSKLRSQIKRACKDGLFARLGHMELIDDFYRVFSRNMRDLGSPVHSLQWLKNIVSGFNDRAMLAVVYKNGFPVGVGLMLMHNRMVTIPWASTLKAFNRLSPNMLLYWKFLEYAADYEFRFFDFGRSTPGEGTYAFKKQWGARPVALSWYRWGRGSDFDGKPASGNNGRLRKAAEKAWQRMPLAAANALGPKLRKYIDK